MLAQPTGKCQGQAGERAVLVLTHRDLVPPRGAATNGVVELTERPFALEALTR